MSARQSVSRTSSFVQTVRFILRHLSRYRGVYFVVFACITVGRFCSSYVTTFYRDFVDTLGQPGATADDMFAILFMMTGLNVLNWSAWRVVGYFDSTIPPVVMTHMIRDAFSYLQHHSYRFFTDSFAGSLVKRINRLPDAYLDISDNVMYNLYPGLVTIVITLWLTAEINLLLTGILAVWLAAFLTINYLLARQRMQFENVVNKWDSRVSGFLADSISNIQNVILFGAHRREESRLKNITSDWAKAKQRSWFNATWNEAVQSALMILIELVLMYVGILLWQDGSLTAGEFIMLQTLLLALFIRIWDFGKYLRKIGEAFSKASEMIEILDTPHEVTDRAGAPEIRIDRGEIEIQRLTFAYRGRDAVFRDFSLTIPAGRKVALVSRSGSGKSTLIRLIMRLYDVPDGTIRIDGQDIMAVRQESLRRQISFVSQDPVLFHRSIRENIAYGKPDATDAEIENAARKAHCHDFITKLPEGYATFVGERGVKLSGGERQRVAIARAILENCRILILDEATSALDSESELYIKESLAELMKEKTAIVIAHRLSTVHMMDEIVVIEDGRITERGTHDALLSQDKGHYAQLWNIQSGGYSDQSVESANR